MVASVAILGYYVLTQGMKYNILYQIPYLISEIGKKFFGTAIYRIFGVIKFPLTGLVLFTVAGSRIPKKRKPFIVAGISYACYYVIFPSLLVFFWVRICISYFKTCYSDNRNVYRFIFHI